MAYELLLGLHSCERIMALNGRYISVLPCISVNDRMAGKPPFPALAALGNALSLSLATSAFRLFFRPRTASHSQHIKPVYLAISLPSIVLFYTALFHTPSTARSPSIPLGRHIADTIIAVANATPQPVSNAPLLLAPRALHSRSLVPSVSLVLDAVRFAIPSLSFSAHRL